MSEEKTTSGTNKPSGARGGGSGAGRIPAEKAKNFKGTIGRLVKMMFANKVRVWLMIVLLLASAGLNALGPKALGNATNVLFEGLISKTITSGIEKELPPNTTIDQVKVQLDDANGNLDVQKFKQMLEQQDEIRAKNPALKDADTVVESEASGGTVDISKIEDMISGMKVRIGAGVDFNAFAIMLLWVILIYLGTFVLRWVAGWISVRIISNVGKTLRQKIEEKLWRLPLSYFDKTSRGEIMSKTTNDLDNVTQTLNQTGGDFLFMVFMVISVVIMMFTVSPLLAVIALLTVPLSFGIIGIIMSKSQPQFKKQWAITGELNGNIEESFTGHTIVKAYGQSDNFMEKFEQQNDQLFEASFKAQFISGVIMPVMTFMTNLNYVVVALIGAIKVSSGTMTLGDIQAFIQYSRQYSQPLGQISQMMNLLQSGAASAERIFELLDAEEEINEDDLSEEKFEATGLIEFKDVDFSYDIENPLIESMNLTANPGQTVAIVGPTGAGKTTLVNLIMRFYEINSGSILLDGTDTRELSRKSLRSNVGMVLQDTWLFKGSIEENLRYGISSDRVVSDEDFLKATRATYVDHFVRTLPDGYKTVLDDESTALSAGEKQLLTIARAFLSDPDILILDEATSSVDTRTEVLIQKAMNALRSNRTSFVIAHRLSTIRDADTILVMDKGSIVEQGNHDELIAKGGRYSELYQSQFENGALEEE